MTKMLGFDGEGFSILECKDLKDYYDYIGCNYIDIARRNVGGNVYDIIVDDEGMLKDSPMITAVSPSGHPMLAGNLLFANHEGAELTSLTIEDVARIMSNVVRLRYDDFRDNIAVVCDYD